MEQGSVRRHDQTNEEKVDDVEDSDTPYNLSRCFWDLLLWVFGFRGSQSSELGASIGEGGGDEDAAKAVEAIEESRVGCMPVLYHQLLC